MLRVRDIMTKAVHVVSPETTVRDAMEMLAHANISGAPVVSGQTLVGVVSTDDLLSFASTLGSVPTQRGNTLEADEWGASELEAADELEVDETEVVINALYARESWDDRGISAGDRMSGGGRSMENSLEAHDVREVMTRDVRTVSSDAPAAEAAGLMRAHGIHRVPVVDGEKLVGIVSALDIAKAVASGRFNPTPAHRGA